MPARQPSALARLMEAGGPDVTRFALPGGATLFEAGESTGMVYVARAGRLAAIRPEAGHAPRWLGVIGPGEPIGEVALLADSHHSATVVALRDCELLAMPNAAFRAALARHPAVVLEMARQLILRAEGGPAQPRTARVFGFVGLDPAARVRGLTETLARAVRDGGASVAVLGASAAEGSTETLSRIEEDHDYVFYCAEADEAAWGAACARQADRLFRIGLGDRPPPADLATGRIPAARVLKPMDLLLIHPAAAVRPAESAAWRRALTVQRLLHIRDGDAGDIGRLARLVTGRSTGLVLSGGGARGYAHVGVIQVLRAAGAPVDFIGGASMGAVVGAALAMGWDDGEIDRRIRKAFVDSNPLGDLAFPRLAMSGGARVSARLAEHFGDADICDLWRPFFCVSSDLTLGAHHVHDRGSIAQALRASIALPGILPPIFNGETVLVDGGVLRNLPTDAMRALHDGPIIAVDVAVEGGFKASDLAMTPSLWAWFASGAWRRGAPIVSLLLRSATVTAARDQVLAREAADLFIAPAMQAIELRDWKAYGPAVAAGRAATEAALAGLTRPITDLRLPPTAGMTAARSA